MEAAGDFLCRRSVRVIFAMGDRNDETATPGERVQLDEPISDGTFPVEVIARKGRGFAGAINF